MVLHDWQRRAIERAFGCPVTNRYGCEEVSLIACECERHGGLHVNADGIYLEVVRTDGTPAEPGEAGSLLVTDLVNRAMPLLCYQVGDVGALSERRCACGRGLPLLDRLEGREADYVVTPRGQLVSGISLTDHFATLVPGVAQLQIIQESVDGSRVARAGVAAQFGKDPRVSFIRTEQVGQPAAKNIGIRLARAPLVAFLDADDQWLPHKLQRQLPLFEAPARPGVVFSER